MRTDLLFVQNGDYREGFERFRDGGEESYLDQRRSVAFVEDLARSMSVAVISAAEKSYDVMLAPRLRAIGIPRSGFYLPAVGRDAIETLKPAKVIPRTGHPALLQQIHATATPSFPTLADIFRPVTLHQMTRPAGLRRFRSNHRFRRLFASDPIVAVGNHGLNAARSLHRVLRVSPERVVPWEWTRLVADPAPRDLGRGETTIFFAGVVSREKGVGELVEAVRLLKVKGMTVRLVIAGDGIELGTFREQAAHAGLGDSVEFLGRIALDKVAYWMRQCQIAVVPSRASYPEGMPNVIFEALAARAALVLSDHPAFVGRLADAREAIFFKEGDAASLAAAIQRIAADEGLYRTLSDNAAAALVRLYVGHSWYELIGKFIDDPKNTTGWVARHSLAALVPN